MYYPLGRFADESVLITPSTYWNPLDANDVILSDFNYTATVGAILGSNRASAAWDNAEWITGKHYWEVPIELCESYGPHPRLSFGFRSAYDPAGLTIASGNLSASYEARELRYVSDGAGSIATSTIPDIAVWHSNPGTLPYVIHAALEKAGNYFIVDPTGVLGFEGSDRLMVAEDRAAGKAWLGKNNAWFNGGNPAAGTNPQISNMDCSEAQYFGSQLPWRFFFATTAGDYSVSPVRFSLATGNNIIPQIYTPPVGFTGLTPPASQPLIGNVWNFRSSSGNVMTGSPFLAATSCWFSAGTIALNVGAEYIYSGGKMFPGRKYYFELESQSTGASTMWGAAKIDNIGSGFPTDGIICLWAQNGNLHKGLVSSPVVINAAGVSGWAAAGTDRLMGAVDLTEPDNGKMWIGKQGTFFNGGNPALGTNPQFTGLPTNKPWVAKVLFGGGGRGVNFNVSSAHYLYPTPAGFTTTIPLIEAYVP